MFRNLFMIVVIGLGGVAILVWLGTWQVQRLQWKQSVLSEIEARIVADPMPLPVAPDAETDKYLPVTATGEIGDGLFEVLTSRKEVGAGHRLVVPFETDGRRVLLDLGFLPQGSAVPEMSDGAITVTGNLHWPIEVDGFTPDPDLATGLWFARDVPAMAEVMKTEPVMIVRRDGGDLPGVTPWPVGTEGIPNNHREYAITWFSLAAIWLAMTVFLVYRRRKPEGDTA